MTELEPDKNLRARIITTFFPRALTFDAHFSYLIKKIVPFKKPITRNNFLNENVVCVRTIFSLHKQN